MFYTAQILALAATAFAAALSLAHALEYPGKLRLAKADYMKVQEIYYPGFTLGGISEPAAILLTLFVLIFTSAGGLLVLFAFLLLVLMQATYWLFTHPVNRFWLKDFDLKGADRGFFALGPFGTRALKGDWTALRDQWEYSHIARTVFGGTAFVLLSIAVTASAR